MAATAMYIDLSLENY